MSPKSLEDVQAYIDYCWARNVKPDAQRILHDASAFGLCPECGFEARPIDDELCAACAGEES